MKWEEVVRLHTEFTNRAFTSGALDVKAKELIAIAVALGIGCEDQSCYSQHMEWANQYGASEEEIAETSGVGMAISIITNIIAILQIIQKSKCSGRACSEA